MTYYTIGEAEKRGLSLAQAACYLLDSDGYAHRFVRRRDGWLDLLLSDGSAASPRGANHFRRSLFVGRTQREAWEWVVAQDDWRGYSATPDTGESGESDD